MKKRFTIVLVILMTMMLLVSCGGEEVTLDLSFGERTGTYEGEMKDGVPHGQGTFTTENKEGEEWTYEGEFKNGHFEGKGTTTWDGGHTETGIYKNDEIQPLSKKEVNKMYGDPENYKNHYVELTGRVFSEPEYADGVMSFQMWADPDNVEKNTIVYVYDEDIDIKDEDYVRVKGIVDGEFSGENMMGGEISAPEIAASECKVISYTEAVAPATRTVKVNKSEKQYGYTVTVKKIEFSERDTRVYLKVDNRGSDNFSLYSFDAKLIQDNKQYKEDDNWDADYKELESDIIPGVSSEGIVAFPKVKEKDFKLIFEAYSENWDESVEPYVFNIKIK